MATRMRILVASGVKQRPGWSGRILALLVCLSVLAGGFALAGEEKMPAARFATFLARMLTYDNNLKERAGARLSIAVLYDGKNPASVAQGTEMSAALKNLELVRIADLPVNTLSLPFTDASELEQAVVSNSIAAFVISDGLEKQFAQIKKVSEKSKIITVGTSGTQVRAGCTIAVYLDSGKSKILVNLPSSRSEGIAFTSDLLGLAEVIQ